MKLKRGFVMPIPVMGLTQGDVLAVIPGLKAKTLQNWNERNLIDWSYDDLPKASLGKGARRTYGYLDLVTIAFISQLAGIGHPIPSAAELAWDARHQVAAWADGHQGSPIKKVVIDGEPSELTYEQRAALGVMLILPRVSGKWSAIFPSTRDERTGWENMSLTVTVIQLERLALALLERVIERGFLRGDDQ